MAPITLKNLAKSYAPGAFAVQDITIDIADGEFVVLVGPSGCGKSTLLRMIAGLETTSSGDILIGGRRVNDTEPAHRDIAMVFQNYALYPHMTVRQNLSYGLKNRGLPSVDITARVNRAAEMLELGHLLDRRPRALSGGQRQRVAMGRALVREPQAFLFDEPLSNLDAKLRVTMRSEIRQLQRRLGTTSVYVTHDQVEAMTLADRLVVLNHGRIEQIGQPLEVYRKPATTFVAGFIGAPAMNLLRAHVDGAALVLGQFRLPCPVALPNGSDVTLGLRPEALLPTQDKADLTMQVSHLEELGAARIIFGHVDGQAITCHLPAGHPVGETLALSVQAEAIHLFGPDGRRMG